MLEVEGLAPGRTLGILGGGQLGFMITQEAHRMGYRVVALDPDPEAPLSRLADGFICAPFTDEKAARRLAEMSDVVTVETEHIPSTVLEHAGGAGVPVRPAPSVLFTIQDRLRQKEFLALHAFPQPAFAPVASRDELAAAVETVGAPAVLKTRKGGYDGKGQARLASTADVDAAWEKIGGVPAILESHVDFVMELSVLLARSVDGDVAFYPIAENVHVNGVLHTTQVPARVSEDIVRQAEGVAYAVAEALDHVGMMAVEMFLTSTGQVLINEVAPRVHNSGHYTFGAAVTSQFEQHFRAVCGLPLGDTTLLSPVVMLNILGDAWANGDPHWDAVFGCEGARLSHYGKKHVRPGRKMGHVLVLREDPEDALRAAERIHDELRRT